MPISHLLDPNVPTYQDLITQGALTNNDNKPYAVWAELGAPVLATAGTDTACTNGTGYVSSLWLPCNKTLTGIFYLIGSVGGTDKVVASLHDGTGALLANSALAGATVGTAANIQSVAFTATYAARAGRYFIALTFNGTTAKFRTYVIPGSPGLTDAVTQTFGTAASFTAPTTFTASEGPMGGVY